MPVILCTVATCSTADVVTGLDQISWQLQGLAAFVMVVAVMQALLLVLIASLLFANGRT